MVTKEERDKLIEQTMATYEAEYLRMNGFIMSSQIKKQYRKAAEKLVDKEIKNAERLSIY